MNHVIQYTSPTKQKMQISDMPMSASFLMALRCGVWNRRTSQATKKAAGTGVGALRPEAAYEPATGR
jgi:hypothetical protein